MPGWVPDWAATESESRTVAPSRSDAVATPAPASPASTVRFTCWDWLSQTPDASGPDSDTLGAVSSRSRAVRSVTRIVFFHLSP